VVVVVLVCATRVVVSANTDTVLRSWASTGDATCTVGREVSKKAEVFECAKRGLRVKWETPTDPTVTYASSSDFSIGNRSISCTDVALQPQNVKYIAAIDNIVMTFVDTAYTGSIVKRVDSLGYKWTIRDETTGSECEVSYGAEVDGTLFGLKHTAVLRPGGGDETFCLPERLAACSSKCGAGGFAIHYSKTFLQAVLVPILSDEQTDCQDTIGCGVGVAPVEPSGTSILSGTYGANLEWSFTASGQDPYILASLNDLCAASYVVESGEFLGLVAPADPNAFQCERWPYPESEIELQRVEGAAGQESCLEDQCISECFKAGFYIQMAPDNVACYTSRRADSEGCECPVGNSTIESMQATKTTGTMGEKKSRVNAAFTATGLEDTIKIEYSLLSGSMPCTIEFRVFKGEFLGVSEPESWFALDVADTTGTAATVMVATAVGSSILGGGAAGIGGALSLLYQVQFISVAASLGGRRIAEFKNGTRVALESRVPDVVQRLSDSIAWVNFKGWGLVDFSDLCPTMPGDFELFDSVTNCLVVLLAVSIARVAVKIFGEKNTLKFLTEHVTDKLGVGGDIETPEGLHFPLWELWVIEAEFQGLCMALGTGLGSECTTYTNTGIVILIGIVGLLFALHMRMYNQLDLHVPARHRAQVVYKYTTKQQLDERVKQFRGQEEPPKGMGGTEEDNNNNNTPGETEEEPIQPKWYTKLVTKFTVFKELLVRGEWVIGEDKNKNDEGYDQLHNRMADEAREAARKALDSPPPNSQKLKPEEQKQLRELLELDAKGDPGNRKKKNKEEYVELLKTGVYADFIKEWKKNWRVMERDAEKSMWERLTPKFFFPAWHENPLFVFTDGLSELKKDQHAHFKKGFKSLFIANTVDAWWYDVWLLYRKLGEGLILGLLYGTANWSAIIALYGVDLIILVVFLPKLEWWNALADLHSSLAHMTILVVGGLFLEGEMPGADFEIWFLLTTIATIVPSFLLTIFIHIPKMFSAIFAKFQGCFEEKKEPGESNPQREAGNVAAEKSEEPGNFGTPGATGTATGRRGSAGAPDEIKGSTEPQETDATPEGGDATTGTNAGVGGVGLQPSRSIRVGVEDAMRDPSGIETPVPPMQKAAPFEPDIVSTNAAGPDSGLVPKSSLAPETPSQQRSSGTTGAPAGGRPPLHPNVADSQAQLKSGFTYDAPTKAPSSGFASGGNITPSTPVSADLGYPGPSSHRSTGAAEVLESAAALLVEGSWSVPEVHARGQQPPSFEGGAEPNQQWFWREVSESPNKSFD